jgi:hypothetical protein
VKLAIAELLLRLVEYLTRPAPLPSLPPDHRGDVHLRARAKRKELSGTTPNRT